MKISRKWLVNSLIHGSHSVLIAIQCWNSCTVPSVSICSTCSLNSQFIVTALVYMHSGEEGRDLIKDSDWLDGGQ